MELILVFRHSNLAQILFFPVQILCVTPDSTHRLIAQMLDTTTEICGFAHQRCDVPGHREIKVRLVPLVAMRIMRGGCVGGLRLGVVVVVVAHRLPLVAHGQP